MKSRNGFSLLELSIALGVIALLLGGIFVGKNMIRSSQLRTAIGEYDRYLKAIQEFSDKYKAFPGDINNATAMWGAKATCPPTYIATPPTASNTCNGNGDGKMGYSNKSADIAANAPDGNPYYYETFLVWQHLSNAGFIDGRYSGAPDADAVSYKLGLNVPQSALPLAGWSLSFYDSDVLTYTMPGHYGHIMSFGAVQAGALLTGKAAITSREAYEIDMKVDDGRPRRGKIRAWHTLMTGSANCFDQSTVPTSNTNYFSNDDINCGLFFITGL